MSNYESWQDELSDVKDGMGCTEIWEKICEKRDEAAEKNDASSVSNE